MKKRWLNVIYVLGLMAASGLYGFCINRYHLFPYDFLQQTYRSIRPQPTVMVTETKAVKKGTQPSPTEEKAPAEEIPSLYYQTDVDQLITINTPEDVIERRQQLVDLLWGEPGLPQRLPDEVQQGVTAAGFEDDDGIERVDRLVIKMDFGLESVAYHYIPKEGNGKLIIWHQGHENAIPPKYLREFLNRGYAVLAFCMPLYCENSRPVVHIPRLGDIKLSFHEYFVFLEPENGHPLKYFLEPVVVGLNYVAQEYDYGHIAMAGYSGGGWSTTLVAALDPRVQSSFPAAGSYPIYLREYRDRGHYEHLLPELYKLANFPELYVMGGYGEGRMQMQVINQYDPCCYAGTKGELYKDQVAQRVQELGAGGWDLLIDPYDIHGISPQAFEKIFGYLDGK